MSFRRTIAVTKEKSTRNIILAFNSCVRASNFRKAAGTRLTGFLTNGKTRWGRWEPSIDNACWADGISDMSFRRTVAVTEEKSTRNIILAFNSSVRASILRKTADTRLAGLLTNGKILCISWKRLIFGTSWCDWGGTAILISGEGFTKQGLTGLVHGAIWHIWAVLIFLQATKTILTEFLTQWRFPGSTVGDFFTTTGVINISCIDFQCFFFCCIIRTFVPIDDFAFLHDTTRNRVRTLHGRIKATLCFSTILGTVCIGSILLRWIKANTSVVDINLEYWSILVIIFDFLWIFISSNKKKCTGLINGAVIVRKNPVTSLLHKATSTTFTFYFTQWHVGVFSGWYLTFRFNFFFWTDGI